jgi:phage gpG-like protein
MPETTAELKGADRIAERLLGYGQHLDNWEAFWPQVTQAFTAREEIWFTHEGEGWAQLDPTYAKWKAVHYPGKPILVRTGDLKRSLTDPTEAVRYSSPHELVLGSDVDYAHWHYTGTSKMPARRPLVPLIRLAGGIANLLQRHLMYPPGFR